MARKYEDIYPIEILQEENAMGGLIDGVNCEFIYEPIDEKTLNVRLYFNMKDGQVQTMVPIDGNIEDAKKRGELKCICILARTNLQDDHPHLYEGA
jgi:hypothetical protein